MDAGGMPSSARFWWVGVRWGCQCWTACMGRANSEGACAYLGAQGALRKKGDGAKSAPGGLRGAACASGAACVQAGPQHCENESAPCRARDCIRMWGTHRLLGEV